MFFIILGAGKVGLRVAQKLSTEGHEVVLIEKERARVAYIYNKIDCRVIVDEGSRVDVLQSANIDRADYFIAVSDSDETNLITCILAKKLAPNIKNVARLRNLEYIKNVTEVESVFPIDYVVNPDRETALAIIRSIEYSGGVGNVLTFANFSGIIMRNYFVDKDSKCIDTMLKDINKVFSIPEELHNQFLISLINRKGQVIIPAGDFAFKEGDELFVLGHQDVLEQLFVHFGKVVSKAKDIRKIFIIGATPIAGQIIDCYNNAKDNKLFSVIGKRRFASREITLIEENAALCSDFVEKYEGITVLHADLTEEDVLEDLAINQADMIIATTPSQERNIVMAAHSYNLGVHHTIALVHNPVYLNIASELDIGMSLSVQSAVVSSIMGFLRGQTLLYDLLEGSYGIFEYTVQEDSKVVYQQIANIILPPRCLILCIQNEKGIQIASGGSLIQPHAKLLCIAHPDSVDRFRELLAPNPIGEPS